MVVPLLVLGLVALWALVPALAGLSLGAAARARVDLSLLGLAGIVDGAALILGSRLPGDGLRAFVIPAWGSTRWVAWRTGSGALALGGLVVVLGAASALVVEPGVDLGLQLVGAWLEALVLMQVAGWARVFARPGLAAVVAATVGSLGHLHAPLLDAVTWWGLQRPVGWLLWLTPSFAEVSLHGELIAGSPVDRAAWALGAAHLVGWSLLLGGGTVATMSRRDPIG